jgi:hypothetical protein
LINGNFETGDFTGWNIVELHGVANAAIEPFDVEGDESSFAARFQAGRWGSPFGPAGGLLLSQTFFLSMNDAYSLSASIAAWLPAHTPTRVNGHGGTFELLLNTTVLDKVIFGTITSGELFRDELRYEGTLSSGTHELAIRIRRDFAADASSPLQFVDNVAIAPISQAAGVQTPMVENPEPGTLLLLAAGLSVLLLGRRRLA